MAKRGNKFGNVNPKFMILGGVVVVVIILVVVIMTMLKTPTVNQPITVDGFYGSYGESGLFDTWTETNPRVDYTAESCAVEAKKRGADIFTLRTANHPAKEFQNTCFGFNSTPDIVNFVGDLFGPEEHVTGCSDTSKTWPNCK